MDKGVEPARVTYLLGPFKDARVNEFTWLTPPDDLGALTIVDVAKATTPDEHEQIVRAWAQCTWEAWSPYHEAIKALASDLG